MSNIRTFVGAGSQTTRNKEELVETAKRLLASCESGEIVSFLAIGIKVNDDCLAYSSSAVEGFNGLKAQGACAWMLHQIQIGAYYES